MIFLGIVLSCLSLNPGAYADLKVRFKKPEVEVLKVKTGKVDFYAIGKPSMLKIHGEDSAVTGTLTLNSAEWSGDFSVNLKEFQTGMKTRDEHLREKVFEVSKYETATLHFENLKVPFEGNGTAKDLEFKGKLKLHGVEKEVSGKVDLSRESSTAKFTAHLELNMKDFEIAPPEFMGMKVQEKVKVDVEGEAT